jgi:hypothetical protein
MGINMAIKPMQPLRKCPSALLTIVGCLFTFPSMASDFLCDATQTSNAQLPLLESSCPIGKGMWGKVTPNKESTYFWIQCGVFSQPLSVSRAKNLYQHISTDVWFKKEREHFRCLIGPYEDYQMAQREWRDIRRQKGYGNVFIRQVMQPMTQHQATKAAKKRQQPNTSGPVRQSNIGQNTNHSYPTPSTRRFTKINGIEYKVPYTMNSNDQFYMEHELPWNRLDYAAALKTCEELGMTLSTAEQWQTLLNAKVMHKDKWPVHLPYWGSKRQGLFSNGKIRELTGTSLLNVLCVKG